MDDLCDLCDLCVRIPSATLVYNDYCYYCCKTVDIPKMRWLGSFSVARVERARQTLFWGPSSTLPAVARLSSTVLVAAVPYWSHKVLGP